MKFPWSRKPQPSPGFLQAQAAHAQRQAEAIQRAEIQAAVRSVGKRPYGVR